MSDMARREIIHYRRTRRSVAPCGTRGIARRYATHIRDVTCGRCLRSREYQQALNNSAYDHIAPVMPVMNVVQNSEHGTFQDGVNAAIKAAHEIARNRGYCYVYDEIIDEVERALPPGITVPPKKIRFEIFVDTDEIEAENEDEVWEKIEANPRDFFSISSRD